MATLTLPQTRVSGAPAPISLVIPLRNEEASLQELIASIRAQTCPPAEILLVDGGSDDDTVAVARRLTADDPRFRIIEAGDATPGRGRNVGITMASYEWIALTDAGIRLEPDWLEALMEARDARHDAKIVYGNYDPIEHTFFERCATLAYVAARRDTPGGPMRGRSIASSLMHRSVWDAVGGFPDLRAAEDLMFMERVAATGFREAWAPRARAWWRLQPTLADTWRRFVEYSRCNVVAGRQRRWHYGVARQYAGVAVTLLLGVFLSPWWFAVPLAAGAVRVGRSIWNRRGARSRLSCFNPAQFALVALIIVTVDAATFVGWAEARSLPRHPLPRPARAPLRVLHLIESLGCGGAERLLYVNLTWFDRTKIDSTVCHLYDRAPHWREPIRDLGYPVMSLGMQSIRDLPRGIIRLSALLKEHPVDLIHTHLYGANLVGRIAGVWRGIPVVSSLHNPDYEPATLIDNAVLSPTKLRLMCWLDRLSCWLADPEFIAVSEYVKQSAMTYLHVPAGRTHVIYNAIDVSAFAPNHEVTAGARQIRRDLNLENDDPVLVCIARVDPQKGHRYLIEAMPALLERFPRLATVFLGDGPEKLRESLIALAEQLGVKSHVHFLGVKSDVRPYLEMCDVFVLPSLYEGMGIVLVEAMAMQRACVATHVAAVSEVVADGRSGVLVPPADPAALAGAITTLLANPLLRARMGAEGRRIVNERFDVAARSIRQLESLYAESLRTAEAVEAV